jgi:hypothetical protein
MPSFRTLNPKKHHVILAGDFTTYGSVNAVGGLTYTAAVYGPASGTFDVINAGVISTYSPQASNTVSAGLLLASPGTVNNLGTISALEGVAVLLQSKAPGDRVVNQGDLYGYAGIQLNGAGTVSNFGSINGGQAGIALIAGGQVDNRGTILSRYGDGIYEYDAPFTTTIYNAGQILGHTAVYLVGQSTVQNRATGTISGTVYGLDLLSVSAVYNQGTIYGARNAVWLHTGGSISNTGTLLGGYGIDTSGGLAYVTNSGYIRTQNTGIIASDGGTISNFGTITGGQGIAIQDPFQLASTVFNHGVITATEDFGVYLISPATLINSGTISGPSNVVNFGGGGELVNYDNISGGMVGVTNESGLLQAYNFGTIVATGNAIQSYNGGHVSNQGFIAGGQGITGAGQGIALVNAPAYVYNRGTILGTNGIFFNTGGGYVVNQKSGIILATGTGITLTGGGWIKNLGDISGGAGINIVGIGTVNNFGTITGSTNDGLRIYSTGTASADVQNFLGSFGGIITSTAANGIEISASYGFMLNSGTISGGENGIFLHGFGKISNSGQISGGEYGVVLGPAANGALTTANLTNTGTIYGAYGGILAATAATIATYGKIATAGYYAILFNAYYRNRLIINAAASFMGAVYGGNGALELADDLSTIGTFSAAEQSTFTGFNSFQIDAGATWDLAGSFTFNSAPTLVNNGIIKESATDTLTVNAAVAGSGTIVMFNEPITFKGAVASTQNILFTGSGEELALAGSVAFKGKIEKFAAHDEIFLTNVSLSQITATHFIAGVLTLSEAATKLEFTFANPASFGNETFKVSAQGHGTAISLVNAAAVLSVSPLSTPSPFITLGN